VSQEGHTAHATPEEAEAEAMAMIQLYAEFATTQAAMPVVVGRKSKLESFAGANVTYTIEAMMGDKKALQVGFELLLLVVIAVIAVISMPLLNG
jgi:prolyl-tRNA synthetase